MIMLVDAVAARLQLLIAIDNDTLETGTSRGNQSRVSMGQTSQDGVVPHTSQ